MIGGLSAGELPDKYESDYLTMVHEATGVTKYLLPPLPNTLFTRNTTCWIYVGVMLNQLFWPVRHEESLLMAAICKFHRSFRDAADDYRMALRVSRACVEADTAQVVATVSEKVQVRPVCSRLGDWRASVNKGYETDLSGDVDYHRAAPSGRVDRRTSRAKSLRAVVNAIL
jgi:Arginine deiminase